MRCQRQKMELLAVMRQRFWKEAQNWKDYTINESEGTNMYIPEFVCGIAATIIVELAAIVAYAVYLNIKKKK